MSDVLALPRHASKLYYSMSEFYQKISVTSKVWVTFEKHLMMAKFIPKFLKKSQKFENEKNCLKIMLCCFSYFWLLNL